MNFWRMICDFDLNQKFGDHSLEEVILEFVKSKFRT